MTLVSWNYSLLVSYISLQKSYAMCITKIQKTFPVGRIIEKNFTLRLSNGFDSCLLISNHVYLLSQKPKRSQSQWKYSNVRAHVLCVGFAGQ